MIIVSVSVYLLPESINNPAKRIRHTFMNNEVEIRNGVEFSWRDGHSLTQKEQHTLVRIA